MFYIYTISGQPIPQNGAITAGYTFQIPKRGGMSWKITKPLPPNCWVNDMAYYKIWIPQFGYTEDDPITKIIGDIDIDWKQAAFDAAMHHKQEIEVGDTVIVIMSVSTTCGGYDRFTFGVTKTEEHYKTEYLGAGSIH